MFKHHDAVSNQRNLKMVAALRAVDIKHNFGKQKQIAIEVTDRWQHFVAVISNQNRYWCQRSVACTLRKRNSIMVKSNFSALKSK
jgi:hypothetical protein